jgi:hypothetical protein
LTPLNGEAVDAWVLDGSAGAEHGASAPSSRWTSDRRYGTPGARYAGRSAAARRTLPFARLPAWCRPDRRALRSGRQTRLQVEDSGNSPAGTAQGLGLQPVEHMVEHGLRGHFELGARAGGGTRAEVVFHEQPR